VSARPSRSNSGENSPANWRNLWSFSRISDKVFGTAFSENSKADKQLLLSFEFARSLALALDVYSSLLKAELWSETIRSSSCRTINKNDF
jgi:hypothetical protein